MKELNHFEADSVAAGSLVGDVCHAVGYGIGYAAHAIFDAENRAASEGATYHSAG
jgi:hypothetical protein